MSDPIRDLEDFATGGTPVTPLPAAEVRRRGDRLRRRRNTLLAVASAVAVAAVIVTPLALAGDNDRAGRDPGFSTRTPTPSPAPTASTTVEVDGAWLAGIPADFPLAAGYPARNGDGTPVEVTEVGGSLPLMLCGREVATDGAVLDAAQAAYTAPEDARSRDLVLYESGDAARLALTTVRSSLEGCAEETIGDTDQVRAEFPYDAGDDSFGWTERYRTDGAFDSGLTVYQVVRVGNGLLLATTYGEGGGPGDPVDPVDPVDKVARATATDADPVVEAMNLFAEHPDAVSAPPDPEDLPRATTSDGIPAGFPVDRDLVAPEGDPVDGPSATAAGVPGTELCGSPVWPSGGSARLAATATGPELRDSRELVLYDTAEESVEVLTGLRDAVAACPNQEVEGGSTQVITSLPGTTGHDTVTFAITYTEGLGGGVYQFTRVGRAVLATYDGGEWGPDSISTGAADATALTGRITPAMCTFAADGC